MLEAVRPEPLPRFWRTFLTGGKPAQIIVPSPLFVFWRDQRIYMRDLSVSEFANWPSPASASAVPPMLAELMGIPHATAVVKVEKSGNGVRVERELEGGAVEVVELPSPCLLAVQTGLNQVRYASLKGIMAAKKKPIDVKTAEQLGLAGKVGAGAAKVRIQKIYQPPKGEGAEIVSGTTDEVVSKLVGKIKELGLL